MKTIVEQFLIKYICIFKKNKKQQQQQQFYYSNREATSYRWIMGYNIENQSQQKHKCRNKKSLNVILQKNKTKFEFANFL